MKLNTISKIYNKLPLGLEKETTKKLIFLQVIFILVQDFFIYTLNFPSIIAYANDLLTITMILLSYKLMINEIKTRNVKFTFILISIFFIFCIISFFINQESIILFVYGLRQTFRFYLVLIISISVLSVADIYNFFEILVNFQIINTILVVYEYCILGMRGDYLGGLFGTVLSCNVPLNIYLCIICAYSIVKYISNNCSLLRLLAVCLSSLGIAGVAELKFFFFEFLLIMFISVILVKPNKKKLITITMITAMSIVLGLVILKILFPLQFTILTNPKYLFYYLTQTDYSGAYSVSRISFVSQINRDFFNNDLLHMLFGFGLGNCETSSISFLNSAFFNTYGSTYNYNWFSSSMKYLETGVIGFLIYLSFYFVILKKCLQVYNQKSNKQLVITCMIITIISFINIFYNNTAYKYINYLCFISFSIPFIIFKDHANAANIFKPNNNVNIPKVIHYCWFGENPLDTKSQKCIETWKKHMPDYEIKLWNEQNFDVNINKYVKEAYNEKKYAFVSDYARLYIIYHNGGIYLDTDIEIIKSFSDLLGYGRFLGLEPSGYVNTGIGFAAEKNNPIIGKLMHDYDDLKFLNDDGSIDNLPCPIRNSKLLQTISSFKIEDTLQKVGNLIIYPSEYFCPMDYENGKIALTDNTYSIHLFSASWYSKDEEHIHAIKRKLNKIFGKNFGTLVFKVIWRLYLKNNSN